MIFESFLSSTVYDFICTSFIRIRHAAEKSTGLVYHINIYLAVMGVKISNNNKNLVHVCNVHTIGTDTCCRAKGGGP